jgi:hypothetical protein
LKPSTPVRKLTPEQTARAKAVSDKMSAQMIKDTEEELAKYPPSQSEKDAANRFRQKVGLPLVP